MVTWTEKSKYGAGVPTRKTCLQCRQSDTIMLMQGGENEAEHASSSDPVSGVRTDE